MAKKNNKDDVRGVYFIYAPNQEKVKIGRSVKVRRRYNQLRTGFMDDGVLALYISTPNEVQVETELHQKFAHLRDNGEWFLLAKELKEAILNLGRGNSEYDVKLKEGWKQIENSTEYSGSAMILLLAKLRTKYSSKVVLGFLVLVGIAIVKYRYRILDGYVTESPYINYLSLVYLVGVPLCFYVLVKYGTIQQMKIGLSLIAGVLVMEFMIDTVVDGSLLDILQMCLILLNSSILWIATGYVLMEWMGKYWTILAKTNRWNKDYLIKQANVYHSRVMRLNNMLDLTKIAIYFSVLISWTILYTSFFADKLEGKIMTAFLLLVMGVMIYLLARKSKGLFDKFFWVVILAMLIASLFLDSTYFLLLVQLAIIGICGMPYILSEMLLFFYRRKSDVYLALFDKEARAQI